MRERAHLCERLAREQACVEDARAVERRVAEADFVFRFVRAVQVAQYELARAARRLKILPRVSLKILACARLKVRPRVRVELGVASKSVALSPVFKFVLFSFVVGRWPHLDQPASALG